MFLKQKDLEKVKKIARMFLYLDIQEHELSPIFVSHPFTNSGFVVLRKENGEHEIVNILNDEAALSSWRKQIAAAIYRATSSNFLSNLICKPYKLVFLHYIQPYLSKEDFSKLLADSWCNMENPNSDPNFTTAQLVSMFKSADPIEVMCESDYAYFLELKRKNTAIVVYRGITTNIMRDVKKLSWTLDADMAYWYAKRFDSHGTVYKAEILPQYIFAYFSSRNETEVVLDPRKLQSIEVYKKV